MPTVNDKSHDYFGSFERYTLENGLTVLLKPVDHSRSVTVQVWVWAGSAYEDDTNNGLSHLTAKSLVEHTGERSMTEMNRHRSEYGFRFSASVQRDYTVLSLCGLEDNADRLLDLLEEVLTKPAFDPKTIDHLKNQQESGLRQRRDDTFRYAFDRALEEFHGDHPYAHPPLGLPGSPKELTAQRVRSFFEEHYSDENLVVSSVGPVNETDIVTVLDRIELSGRSPTLKKTDPPDSGDTRSTITRAVDQPTHVVVYPAEPIDDSKYIPYKVTETMLGGGMGSILFQRLREERSQGYQVGASYPSRRQRGTIRFYLGGGSPDGKEFRSVLREVLDEFATQGPSEKVLHKAREYRKGRFRLDHESPGKVAWYRGFYETMGRGAEFDRRYTDTVDAVDPESVRGVLEDLRTAGFLHLTVLPEDGKS